MKNLLRLFLYSLCIFSTTSSFLLTPSCTALWHGSKCTPSAALPSSSPSTCVALQTLLLHGVSTFLSKTRPPGPGLLVRDSTRAVPCLFNVSPTRRRRTTCFHRNLSPRLLSLPSTCCVIVATRDGDWERGLAGGYVCVSVKTGERGISLRAPSCPASWCLHMLRLPTQWDTVPAQHFLRTHERTHARTHPPNHAWSPYPPTAPDTCFAPRSRCACDEAAALLIWHISLVRHSIFITCASLGEISPQSGSPFVKF